MGLSAVIARFKQTASGRGRIYAARHLAPLPSALIYSFFQNHIFRRGGFRIRPRSLAITANVPGRWRALTPAAL